MNVMNSRIVIYFLEDFPFVIFVQATIVVVSTKATVTWPLNEHSN
jgi:hypothetical protein